MDAQLARDTGFLLLANDAQLLGFRVFRVSGFGLRGPIKNPKIGVIYPILLL